MRNALEAERQAGPAGAGAGVVSEWPAGIEAADVRRELGLSEGERFILNVGNLRPVKNHLLFIEAMGGVARRHPGVRGVIVGQPLATAPDLPDMLHRRVGELGLEGVVVFAGFRPDVPWLLRAAAIVCLTSDREGFPNVIVEAMAAGRPVVSTRVGGVPEVVEDGVTGLLVPPRDQQALVAALDRVLTDAALAERIGTAAREAVGRGYAPDRSARRWAAFYEDALQRACGGAAP